MSSPITLTWTFQTLTGVADPTGVIQFTLLNYGNNVPLANGNILSPLTFSVSAIAGSGSTTIWGNDNIAPTGTFYQLRYTSSNGSYIATASFQITGSGTVNLNLLNPITSTPGTYIQIGNTGPAGTNGINGAPGTSNVPWQDIQAFGGFPDNIFYRGETAECTTTSGSPNVTLNTARTFVNGQGVCIWQGGAATSQSPASAPTGSATQVQGSSTINYKIVGYDAMGGLTAASSALQVTNAPAIFGNVPVAISSISITSDVVTVNFSSPINAVANQTVHIRNVTGITALNGIWTVTSAPTTSSLTFALNHADGTGTVSGSSTGRLSNTQLITAISRDANGVISITTAFNHGWVATSATHPTIVIIENTGVPGIDGHFPLATASGNTATTQPTQMFSAVTVTIPTVYTPNSTNTGLPTATVWESITLACPALSGSPFYGNLSGATLGYYIYSDSPNPGGSLVLIGRTRYQESHFVDYGPNWSGGYVAPAYVPTTAPASAQNQMWTGTIKSGGGTTSLVMNTNVTSSLTSLSGTIMHDDGPALVAAANARNEAGHSYGPVMLTPSLTNSDSISYYIFNSPITIPANVDILFGCAARINETISWGTNGNTAARMLVPLGSTFNATPTYGRQSYCRVDGLANPFIMAGLSTVIDGMYFAPTGNGVDAVQICGAYSSVFRSSFDCESFSNTVGLCFNGGMTSIHLTDVELLGENVFGAQNTPGNSVLGPVTCPVMLIRASDNAANGGGVGSGFFYMDGVNNAAGRGILIDTQYQTNGNCFGFWFGESNWWNPVEAPTIMFMGSTPTASIDIRGVANDSCPAAIIANFTNSMQAVTLHGGGPANQEFPVITGNRIIGLRIEQMFGAPDALPNVDCVQDLYGSAKTAGVDLNNPNLSSAHPRGSSATLQSRPLIIGAPYGVILSPAAPVVFTAVASGVGTIPAGTVNVWMTSVGWDGGESAKGLPIAVTVNGSQGILVSWTVPTGMENVNVYTDGGIQTQPSLGATSKTYTALGGGGANPPTLDGSGPLCIGPTMVVLPELVIPVGNAPVSSGAAGSTGQFAWDATHIYVCVAPNTWVRATLATF